MNPPDDPIQVREIWPPGTVITRDYVIELKLGGGGFGSVCGDVRISSGSST